MKKLICALLVCNLFLLAGRSLQDVIAGAAGAAGRGGGVVATENGDANGDGKRDISDPIYLLNWLFGGGEAPVACAGGGGDLEERVARIETIIGGCFNLPDRNTDGTPDCAQPGLDSDGDGFAREDDCDDGNAQIHPGATEVCDGIDNDCDAMADEGFDLTADRENCGQCGRRCGMAEACIGGECIGICTTAAECDDGNPCTIDTCFEDGSCIHQALDGEACEGGICVGGVCVQQ